MTAKQRIVPIRGSKEIDTTAPALEWAEKRPLQRDFGPAPIFPVGSLAGLSSITQKSFEFIQAPTAVCGFAFVAATNLPAQAHVDIEIDGRVSPISLYFLTVAASGERKTAVDTVALFEHREWQIRQWGEYLNERQIYLDGLELFKSERAKILNGSLKDKSPALAKLQRPDEPLPPIILASEPTYEGLVKQVTTGLPFIGLSSDEGGRFIGGHAMDEKHQLKTAAGLSSLWDRGSVDRVRSGDGSSLHYGKRVNFHLMVQQEVSTLLLSNRMLKDQGFLSRCLVARPDSVRKIYKEIDVSHEPDFLQYNKRIKDLLSLPLPIKEGTLNSLAPRRLRLDDKAKRLYIALHNDIQSKVGPNEQLEPIRGFAAKAHDHAARLAATLAIYNDINCTTVSLDYFEAGARLVEYCISELLRLIDVNATDETLLQAQKLLAWLKLQNLRLITLVEIYKTGPNFVRSASKARHLMELLWQHGHVRPSDERIEYDGTNRAETWEVRQ